MREMRHPYIVRYYDRIVDKASTTINIIMEFCEGGDIGRIIRKCQREGFVRCLGVVLGGRLWSTA